jgi:hypothetical protein
MSSSSTGALPRRPILQRICTAPVVRGQAMSLRRTTRENTAARGYTAKSLGRLGTSPVEGWWRSVMTEMRTCAEVEHALSRGTSIGYGGCAYSPAMTDTTPLENGNSDHASGKRRWLCTLAGILVVALLGVGVWQVVELHRQVSDLQTRNQSQQDRLKSQQSQLDGLDAALSNTATGTSFSRIEGEISTIQGVTTHLGVRIGYLEQALNTTTVNSDGTLFVAIRGC